MPRRCIEMSFFTELKRRNVIPCRRLLRGERMAARAGGDAGLSLLSHRGVGRALGRGRSLHGFPFAMVFSWFYEWTSHGLILESEISPNESITRQTGRKLDRWIIAILGMAVVLLLANQFVLHRDENKTADGPSAATPIPGKSIAVLPFADLSPKHDQESFSDGMAEEILNALTRIKKLKVVGRASSFQLQR